MAQPGDVGRHLDRWQLTTFTRLGSLGHLDFEFVGVHQIFRCHTEAARSNLLDAVVGLGIVGIDVRIFATFSGVAAPAEPVHGDAQGAMSFGRNCTQGHSLRTEAAQ